MKQDYRRAMRALLLLVVMMLGACSSIKPSPGSGSPAATSSTTPSAAKPGMVQAPAAATFKLTRVSLTWLDNPGLPVLLASNAKGDINSGDMARVLAALRVNAPRDLQQQLKTRQVVEGGNESITLMPIGGLLNAQGETTAVIVRAIVTQRASGAQWRVELELGNRRQPVAIKPGMNTDAASAPFAAALIAAMSNAGLL